MAELKSGFDLWNSHVFVVGALADRSKYQELISGTFHEVENHMRYLELSLVKDLLDEKRAYKTMEHAMGIFRR